MLIDEMQLGVDFNEGDEATDICQIFQGQLSRSAAVMSTRFRQGTGPGREVAERVWLNSSRES